MEKEFDSLNAAIIGASTDSVYAHKAWVERDLPGVKFPVVSDNAHTLSRSYGMLIEDQGIALRGTFIVDPDGYVRHVTVSDLSVGRSVKETLRVLQALQTGELCPVDWGLGGKTLGKA